MTEDEVAEVVAGFAVCQAGGFDGVAIDGVHGYLVQRFLSPASNRRTDADGGEHQRRRCLREIVAAVRAEVGDELVVGLRISGDELQPGGLGAADIQRIVAVREAASALDCVSVAVDNYGSMTGSWRTCRTPGTQADVTCQGVSYWRVG